MFKYGGDELVRQMQKLIKEIWIQEQMPSEWNEATICPIYKKGDKSECSNYRGIALLNSAYKIFAQCIKNRLIKHMENTIGEYQSGFRQGRSTTDQLFILREIQAESYEYKKTTYVLFVDFKQAYDKVNREKMYKALKELGINNKLINLIRLSLKKTEIRVRIKDRTSEKFEVKEGVRQGDPLSSILFNLILEKIIREAKLNRTGLLYHLRHQCLAYADDIVIMTRSKKEIREVVKRLEQEANKMGLEINEAKTKFMSWTDLEFRRGQYLDIQTERGRTYNFEEVENFRYLGTIITRSPEINTEIQARIMAGNKCMHALGRLLRSKSISRKTKVRIYKTVLRPIVTYGSEVWTLNRGEQNCMKIWERKVLRKIFGGKMEEGIWIRRTNQEVEEMYGEPNIVALIKSQRLRWLGHVERMSETRLPKCVIRREIGSKKRRGRPRTRWWKEVEKDLGNLKIPRWKEKVLNKKEWRETINQAMGLLGS